MEANTVIDSKIKEHNDKFLESIQWGNTLAARRIPSVNMASSSKEVISIEMDPLKLENIYWRNTMDFTSEMFNDSQNYPGDFVNKWIINECLEMISGLELLLNRDQEYELVESYFHPSQKIKIEGKRFPRQIAREVGPTGFLNQLANQINLREAIIIKACCQRSNELWCGSDAIVAHVH